MEDTSVGKMIHMTKDEAHSLRLELNDLFEEITGLRLDKGYDDLSDSTYLAYPTAYQLYKTL